MNEHGILMADSLINSGVTMTTSDQLLAHNAVGDNSIIINELSLDTKDGSHDITEINVAKGATVTTKFANGQQTAFARNGAYNNSLELATTSSVDKTKNAIAHQRLAILITT